MLVTAMRSTHTMAAIRSISAGRTLVREALRKAFETRTAILGRHSWREATDRRRDEARAVARRREGQRLPARRRPHLDIGFERDAWVPERLRHHPYDLVDILVDS